MIVFLAALALHLLAPPSAESKGTVVRAPAELKSADCMPGSRPRLGTEPRMERFYSDQEVLVIGCGPTSGEAKALVAVERERHGLVCSYMALEGRWDADPRCLTVNPEADAACCPRVEFPYWGDDGVHTFSAARLRRGGPIYFSGQASASLAAVVATYRMPSGETRERAADLLPIRPPIARRIGAAGPFAYFVAEIPAGADTCRGVAVEGRDGRGLAVDRESLERFARAHRSAPLVLPGTNGCRADPLRGAISELIWLPLAGWRSLPLLNPSQVAEILRVERPALRDYFDPGLLVPIKLGKLIWYVRDDVEALCEIRRGCP